MLFLCFSTGLYTINVNEWVSESTNFVTITQKWLVVSHHYSIRSIGSVMVKDWLDFGWPWESRSMSNWPRKFSVGHFSATARDIDLWLITMRDDVIVHYLSYERWPWEIRSRSNQLTNFSIRHISVTVIDTVITVRDDVNVHHLKYLWWPWGIRSRSNKSTIKIFIWPCLLHLWTLWCVICGTWTAVQYSVIMVICELCGVLSVGCAKILCNF